MFPESHKISGLINSPPPRIREYQQRRGDAQIKYTDPVPVLASPSGKMKRGRYNPKNTLRLRDSMKIGYWGKVILLWRRQHIERRRGVGEGRASDRVLEGDHRVAESRVQGRPQPADGIMLHLCAFLHWCHWINYYPTNSQTPQRSMSADEPGC